MWMHFRIAREISAGDEIVHLRMRDGQERDNLVPHPRLNHDLKSSGCLRMAIGGILPRRISTEISNQQTSMGVMPGPELIDHVQHRRQGLCDERRNTYALVYGVVESAFFLDRAPTSLDYRWLDNFVADSLCALGHHHAGPIPQLCD